MTTITTVPAPGRLLSAPGMYVPDAPGSPAHVICWLTDAFASGWLAMRLQVGESVEGMMGMPPASPATVVTRANERLKLLATALNNLALAFVVAGYVGPVVSGGIPGTPGAIVTVIWLIFGVGLHGSAQWVLGRLR